MAELDLSHTFDAPEADVWEAIAFGALADWHPLVPNLELSEGGAVRTMGFGPMTAVERLTEQDERSYTYIVEKSPMPVKDYTATWSVSTGEDGAVLRITATYEPKGPPEMADQLLQAFFAAAFKALDEKLA